MTSSASHSQATPRLLLAGLGLWLAVAAIVGASGLFYGVPAEVVGATNASLTAASLLLLFFVPSLRQWALTVPLRGLVLYHLVRFVGIAFLVLHARGKIPSDFAITAGWGDIAVAVSALAVALFALPLASRAGWWALLLWNVFGLFDILFVLRTGITMGFADMTQMLWITEFPLSLLPTFIVPLVLVTHAVIFVRLWKPRAQPASALAT